MLPGRLTHPGAPAAAIAHAARATASRHHRE